MGVEMGEVVNIIDVETGEVKPDPKSREAQARDVLSFLNAKAGRNYRPTRVNLKFIEDRLKEGYTMEDCKQVVVRKCREWKGGEMDQYLRPATLFNATKFNQYAGELV
jgi:uncharacterized phage protein (TIGR02220 family)